MFLWSAVLPRSPRRLFASFAVRPLTVLIGVSLSVTALAESSGSPCIKGRAVSVQYAGAWYPAKVLDGPDPLGTCLVAYDGYGSNWDEWVNVSRMGPAAGQPAAAAEAWPVAVTVPVGRYGCYSYDNGRLNYLYTDVHIRADGRYVVGEQGGRYTLGEGGALRFTGALAKATGTFSVKTGGRAQIDLVFHDDTRASMACSASP